MKTVLTNAIILGMLSSTMSLTASVATAQVDAIHSIPFRVDADLEKNPLASAQQCLRVFMQKGGTLHSIASLSDSQVPSFCFNIGDAIYPICSGGWCRSQTLFAMLQPFSHQIVLFPPHAARVGWDPYNGQINRYRNYAQEEVYDEFSSYFGKEKCLRFGFENVSLWETMEHSPTEEGLRAITLFYDEHYFGPRSSWQGRQGKRRIYIAFSNNAHVALYRLNQTNESLRDVTVIAIDSDDVITNPPSFLHTTQRSAKAYDYFLDLIKRQFDCTALCYSLLLEYTKS